MTTNKVLDKARDVLNRVGERITAAGVNFAAREPVYMAVYGPDPEADAPENPFETPELVRLNPAEPALTVLDLRIGSVTRWRPDGTELTGDARIEIPQGKHTREQLSGQGLPDGQALFYLLGAERYTVVEGGITDADGLFWNILLKQVRQ